jgi:hypothetical protein
MNKSVPVIGFLILTVIVLAVYGFGAYQAWTLQPIAGIAMTIILLGLVYKIASEARGLSKVEVEGVFTQKNLLNFVAVVGGVAVTFYLNHTIGLGAVVAAGLVEILAALLLPKYGAPIATGAFAGMASGSLLCSTSGEALAAIVAGTVYVLTTGVYGGFGGKLGTIGVSGCIVCGLCTAGVFGQPAVPGWDVGWIIVVISIAAAVITYAISIYLKHGAVMASGIVGVVAGLILPVLFPEIGGTLAVMAICASFVGMSSAKHFPNALPLAVAGLFLGLIFIYSMPFLGGAGGKLGTMAFGSGLAVRGFMDLLQGRKSA